MKFDVMLIGVGGEGVLTSGVMIARAADYEGNYVRGVQLHGLAQRSGTIPTFVRFDSDKNIYSPSIMQANADIVLAFEPLEAVRATYYARKDKTTFVISDFPHMPIYANLLNLPYPSMDKIVKKVKPFAKKVLVFEAHPLAKEKFGKIILGNTILLGAAIGAGVLPLKEKSMRYAIKLTAPRDLKENFKAFEFGIKLGKERL